MDGGEKEGKLGENDTGEIAETRFLEFKEVHAKRYSENLIESHFLVTSRAFMGRICPSRGR